MVRGICIYVEPLAFSLQLGDQLVTESSSRACERCKSNCCQEQLLVSREVQAQDFCLGLHEDTPETPDNTPGQAAHSEDRSRDTYKTCSMLCLSLVAA